MSKLTDKQEAFCQEYLKDLNATQSAIRAGYSKKTARIIATENLSKLNIQARIQELMSKREERTEVTQDNVLKDIHLARQIAIGNKPHKMVIKEGLGEGVTMHKEIELHKTDINAFIKLTELQMKHLGMFEKDNSQQQTTIVVEAKEPDF